jgi:hypothetical protein
MPHTAWIETLVCFCMSAPLNATHQIEHEIKTSVRDSTTLLMLLYWLYVYKVSKLIA